MSEAYLQAYLSEVVAVLTHLPHHEIHMIVAALDAARSRGATVYLIGNGGSGATASHFANDLLKNTLMTGRPRLKAVALTDNTSVLLAFGNDCGFERVFVEQLDVLASLGDVLIAFSGSGRSPNVLHALDLARRRGMTTIGFTGRDGGEMLTRCDHCLVAPCEMMERIEDVHMVLAHAITAALREAIPA